MSKRISCVLLVLPFLLSLMSCKTRQNLSKAQSTSAGIVQSPVGKVASKWYRVVSYARDDYYLVSGGTPMDLVKAYIKKKYQEMSAPELGDSYKYIQDSRTLPVDQDVAGVLKADEAKKIVLDSISYIRADDPTGYDKISGLMDELIKAGAAFGFDGFEQNACAAPSPFLLIIDQKGQQVIGIDLTPCEE